MSPASSQPPEQKIIASFYEAFGRRDADAMAACYHPEIVFRDPAFGELKGTQAMDMWRMLCKAGKDLKVEVSNITGGDGIGSAHWDADYTFATGRKVHNVVDATFTFHDGLIIRHIDDFDYPSWAKQAFGTLAMVLAKTPIMPVMFGYFARYQLGRYSAARQKQGA